MDAFITGDDDDGGSGTNLDVPHLLDTPPPAFFEGEEYIPAEAPTSADLAKREEVARPTKKVRYDKLGREMDAEHATTPVLPSMSADEKGQKVKRPRGRPPKGKVWHDKKGWIDEGLGGGPSRRML